MVVDCCGLVSFLEQLFVVTFFQLQNACTSVRCVFVVVVVFTVLNLF